MKDSSCYLSVTIMDLVLIKILENVLIFLCGVADKYKDAYDFLKDIIKRNESHIIDQIKDYYHTNDLNEFLNNISFG